MKENRAHYCVGVSEVPLEGLVVGVVDVPPMPLVMLAAELPPLGPELPLTVFRSASGS